MEPAFREIFKPDYTVSIPKLYTKLSAYMLLFHCWSDMFAYYPHRLSPGSSGLQPARYTPSWVPDFTRPAEIKEGEKRPHKNETDVTDNSGRPYIINQVLFMGGLLLDEIVHVFPLPRNDPFKVLQQLWYIERLYGRPGYELLHSNSPGDSDSGNSFDSFVQKTKGVSVYPSIAWATRFSEGLPHDISIVHIIFKTANLKGLSVAIDKVLDMRTVCLEQQLEREGKKFGRGASREERDEYWRRDEEISGRLSALMKFVLGDKWLDFIGICTFDFESLRAQVQHRLVPISPWKPSRLPGRRVVDQCEVDLCDPPFTSAVMQRPVRYSSLLRAIVKDVKSGAELRMREEAVMLLAEVVHDATIKVVGGQNEVSYFRPGSQKGDGDAGKENSNVVHHSDRDANDIIYDGKDEIDERVQTIINDFVMDPLPIDVTIGDYPDTPLVAFRALQEEIQTVNRIDNYLEQPEKTSDVNNIVEEGEGEDHVVSKSSESTSHFDEVVGNKNADSVTKLHSSGTLGGRISEPGDGTVVEDEASSEERPLGTLQRGKDGMHGEVEVSSRHNTPVRSISMMSQESSSTSEETPSGSMSQWRRIEKRALNDVHILLTGVVDFLAGREFFLTETRLLGLTYPGTQGVRDGDDLLLLEGMSFPLVARLEPSKELGNPKKRRRDMPTKGMRREIVGTAIVRDIDANGGKLDEAQIPAGLEPLSGFTPGFFRFK
jgi:hypothetical protein